jgi:hypothetical protein
LTTNSERAFADGTEVFAAGVQLNSAVKAGMDLRHGALGIRQWPAPAIEKG